MTVTYTAEVATCSAFGCFLKLLFRWRGSIYKLVWLDLIAFLVAYFTLTMIYRVVLDKDQKIIFEGLVKYCAVYTNRIPLSFVLGFYVTIVMNRWWDQYSTIPWPDTIAVAVSASLHGHDERGRVMRRNVMRYVILCLTMALTMISPRVKKRFPTLEHLVEAGLLEANECNIIESFNSRFPRHSKQWMPIVWAASIVTRARKEGRILNDHAVKSILDELNKFRGKCGILLNYDNISVPLVYTQVVTLAVYSFFIASVMASQWYHDKKVDGVVDKVDVYFPIFTTLQFFFYMGWLKVAETLINPFGDDDDDFEVNWLIDRNLQVSYMIVDEMHHEHPELIRDQYWDEVFPEQLPYTVATEQYREEPPKPSTANVGVTKSDGEVLHPVSSKGKLNLIETTSSQVIDVPMSHSVKSSANISLAGSHKGIALVPSGSIHFVDQRAINEQVTGPTVAIKTPLVATPQHSSDDQTDDDEFEKLRLARQKERIEKKKLISTSAQLNRMAMDILEYVLTKSIEGRDQESRHEQSE
ncbi:Bestrophin homolog [Sergentomyia squamirostris]